VASPVLFDEISPDLVPGPEIGADTDRILIDELNYDWESLISLKTQGIIS
jgi:hypothetical protein